jgi:alpha-beta hydrolase superfamily lysophospholipase
MKQAIFYIILFTSLITFGCSSKQDMKTGASENQSGNSIGKIKNNSYEKEEISLKASDGIRLSADYYSGEGKKDQLQPLVVLIHQFRQSKEQWDAGFIESLISAGYKVIAYDIRGHGNSEKVNYDLTDLLSDPEKAPKDLEGIFNWAKEQKGIDSQKIAVIGTSIGGNLACYAKFNLGAKTVIAISNGADGFEKLNGIDPRMMGRVLVRIADVLIITGSRDGDHEKDAKYIMDNYIADPKELNVIDSEKHGIYLLREHPELNAYIINWLKKYL